MHTFEEEVLPWLKKLLKRKRTYATFFEWPDKSVKECGIVQTLIDSVSGDAYQIDSLNSHSPDPPDCTCKNISGGLVALEVVEFVLEEAVERSARGEKVWVWWEPERVRRHIQHLLKVKDEKEFDGGPYAEIVIVIHTDEPALTADDAHAALSGIIFGPFDQITRAFLLFSYVPSRDYEAIELSLET